MSHGEGWRFLLLGVYLERAQLIARLLEVCFGDRAGRQPLTDHLAQMAVLRMACALEPYLRVYTAEIKPALASWNSCCSTRTSRARSASPPPRIEEHLTCGWRATTSRRAAPGRSGWPAGSTRG